MEKIAFTVSSSGRPSIDGDLSRASLLSLRATKADVQRHVRAHAEQTQVRLAAGKSLTADERANMQAGASLLADVSAALERREATNEDERAAAERADGGGVVDGDTHYSRRAASSIPGGAHEDVRRARPARSARYADLFPQARGLDGWSSAAEYSRCVSLGLHDPRLRAATMDGSSGSGGGFLIPPSVFGPIWDGALEDSIVLQRATIWPMSSRTRAVPAWDLNDRSSGEIAGLELQWEGEAPIADSALQVAKLRMITLQARRAAIFVEASDELAADAPNFDADLGSILQRALSYGLDRSFLFGLGAASPLGVFQSPALISVARTTSNDIIYDDALALYARLSPASLRRAIWLAHSSTLPKLLALSIPIGTAGAAVPAVLNTNGELTLLGRPIVISEKVAPLGSANDLSLLDLSQYFVGARAEGSLEKSMAPGFRRSTQTYRLTVRVDGMPSVDAPTTPPNSAATQSSFVSLAA